MKPRCVLHLLGTAQPAGTGIARIVADLARGLDPQRYQLDAWFLNGDGPLADELREAGGRVKTLKWSGGLRDPAGAWRFRNALRGQNFGLIHQHCGGRAPHHIARRAMGAKVVFHLWAHISEADNLRPAVVSMAGVDAVIATSQAVAQAVMGAPPRSVPTHVVYPGVALPPLSERQTAPPQREIVLGTGCRLVPMKGVIYLLRALALVVGEFPALRLEIAGDGPLRAELEAEVEASKLRNHVNFLGWQPSLPVLLRGWDIYVQPSLMEPFGIATLEAMAAGLPVVATNAGGLPEFVQDGRTGTLAPPEDPAALADGMRRLLIDAEQRRAMGAAGRKSVEENFSIERMVAKVTAIYDEVLGVRS